MTNSVSAVLSHAGSQTPHRPSAATTNIPRAAHALLPTLQAQLGQHTPLWTGTQHPSQSSWQTCLSSGFPDLNQELPGAGWASGQITELLYDQPGIGELNLILPCLAQLGIQGKSCVWVLPDTTQANAGTPYAPSLQAAGLSLQDHVFVRAKTARESIWAMEQSLRNAHLGALIAWMPSTYSPDAQFRSLRRLQLLAQSQGTLVFLLRSAQYASAPSPASLRLHLQAVQGRLQIQILKRRAQPLLDPVLLQIHPHSWNEPISPRAHPVRHPVATTVRADHSIWNRLRQLVSNPPALGAASAA